MQSNAQKKLSLIRKFKHPKNQKIMVKFNSALLLFLFLAAGLPVNAQSIEKDLDALFEAAYHEDHPGAIVLIAKDGKPIYRKGFGLANLELGVTMKPENVMFLASMTKQFTAVAILMLLEEGKLSLQDPVSKFISDYPNGGNITIHHLLTHTSGIKDVFSLPGLSPMALDKTPSEIIAVFRDEPVNFLPGDNFEYSNSGYVLLGYIIEKLSGMTYEDFIETKIFQTLEMKDSRYGSNKEIVPNRGSGYYPDPSSNGYKNPPFVSMTLPYAAGALMSSVDDMLLWNQTMHKNLLISEKSKQLAFKPTILNNGEISYYGYGWRIDQLYDSPVLEHGGVLFGFKSSGIYLPKENIYTIILTNYLPINPTNMSFEATAIVLGKPKNRKPIPVAENLMKQWTGVYAFGDGAIRMVTYKNGSLYSRLEGAEPIQVHALSENEYRFDKSFATYTFKNVNGKNTVVFANGLNKSKGEQTEIKSVALDKTIGQLAPAERKSIIVDPAILKSYSGIYELPGFVIKITTENGHIFAQTKELPFEIFPETPEKFFIKAFPGTITFKKDAQGNVRSFTLDEGGKKREAFKTR